MLLNPIESTLVSYYMGKRFKKCAPISSPDWVRCAEYSVLSFREPAFLYQEKGVSIRKTINKILKAFSKIQRLLKKKWFDCTPDIESTVWLDAHNPLLGPLINMMRPA